MAAKSSPLHDIQSLQRLIEAAYDGPGESPPWTSLLSALRRDGACSAAYLVIRPPAARDRGRIHASGLPQGPGAQRYLSHFYRDDPFVELPPNRAVTLQDVLPTPKLVSSTFYRECLAPLGIHHILGMDLCAPGGLRANLRLTRPEDAPPFAADESRLLEWLRPHLSRALCIDAERRQAAAQLAVTLEAMTQLEVGCLLIDADRDILEANPVARSILNTGDGIAARGERLLFARSSLNRELARWLDTVPGSNTDGCSRVFRVERRHNTIPLGLVMHALPRRHWREGAPTPAAVAFLRDPGRSASASPNTLRALYKLTRQEARIATRVANGLTLDEVAAELDISRNTVRAHLRAVYPKMGVSHQHMLAGQLWRSIAQLGDAPGTDTKPT